MGGWVGGCFSCVVEGCSLGTWNERRGHNSDRSGGVRDEAYEAESFLYLRVLNGPL